MILLSVSLAIFTKKLLNASSNYLFRSDLWRFREKLQQLEGMGVHCKLPLGVWGQNAIQMQENSVQFNNFWSKI